MPSILNTIFGSLAGYALVNDATLNTMPCKNYSSHIPAIKVSVALLFLVLLITVHLHVVRGHHIYGRPPQRKALGTSDEGHPSPSEDIIPGKDSRLVLQMVPTSVWERIFLSAVDSLTRHHLTNVRMQLGLVCQEWRKVTVGCPELWRYVYLVPGRIGVASLCVSRSRDSLLDVHVEEYTSMLAFEPGELLWLHNFLLLFALRIVSLKMDAHVGSSVIELEGSITLKLEFPSLCPLHRLTELDLTTYSHIQFHTLQDLLTNSQDHLRVLIVRVLDSDESLDDGSKIEDLPQLHFPALRVVEFTNCRANYLSRILQLLGDVPECTDIRIRLSSDSWTSQQPAFARVQYPLFSAIDSGFLFLTFSPSSRSAAAEFSFQFISHGSCNLRISRECHAYDDMLGRPASLIAQGLLEYFPNLKELLVETCTIGDRDDSSLVRTCEDPRKWGH